MTLSRFILIVILISPIICGHAQSKVEVPFEVTEWHGSMQYIFKEDTNSVIIDNKFQNSSDSYLSSELGIKYFDGRRQNLPDKYSVKRLVIDDSPNVLFNTDPTLEGYGSKYMLLNLINGSFTELPVNGYVLAYRNAEIFYGQLTTTLYDGYGDYISEVRSTSIKDGSKKNVLNSNVDPEKAEGIIFVLPFQQKIYFGKAYCYIPLSGCSKPNIYELQLNSGMADIEAIELSFIGEITQSLPIDKSTFYIFSDEKGHILTEDGEEFTVVGRNLVVVGWNYDSNGSLVSYNVKTTLDEYKFENRKTLKEVAIEFMTSYNLEMCLLKVIENEDVKSLKEMNIIELQLLKNFIFAKHNYAFDSHFYQAYFNLFDFYNTEEKRASRTKDVNNKLTETDLKNLNLINKAIEKLK